MVTNIISQTNIHRLSVNFQGNNGNNFSINPSISADSRYIAFESAANNLVIGDTNNQTDIFIRLFAQHSGGNAYLKVV